MMHLVGLFSCLTFSAFEYEYFENNGSRKLLNVFCLKKKVGILWSDFKYQINFI
jgi:hypothetical protein